MGEPRPHAQPAKLKMRGLPIRFAHFLLPTHSELNSRLWCSCVVSAIT